MQRVQNAAAKMVLLKTKYDSSMDALKRLHWLPIRYCVDHKMLTLVYKCLHNKAPDYLKKLAHGYWRLRKKYEIEQSIYEITDSKDY